MGTVTREDFGDVSSPNLVIVVLAWILYQLRGPRSLEQSATTPQKLFDTHFLVGPATLQSRSLSFFEIEFLNLSIGFPLDNGENPILFTKFSSGRGASLMILMPERGFDDLGIGTFGISKLRSFVFSPLLVRKCTSHGNSRHFKIALDLAALSRRRLLLGYKQALRKVLTADWGWL